MKININHWKIKIIMLLIITFGIITVSKYTFAASTSITASKTSVNVGDTVTISANIKDTEAWNLKLSASGGELSGTTEDADSAGSETSKKVLSASFKATKEGTYTIKLSGQITGSDLKKQTVSEAVKITVSEKKQTSSSENNNSSNASTSTKKSSNANLKTLGVTPKQYDFSGFNKNKTKYSVTVPANVDSLKVIAKAEDSKASLKITGNSGFDVGSNNTIKIVVTAEDKTTKTYEINVTKLAEEEEKPGNVIDEDEDLYLSSLEIEGIELTPEFSKDVYSYSATVSDANLTSVNVKAKANIEKANIEITGDTNLVEGENTVNIVVKNGDKTVTYQIILTKAVVITGTAEEQNNNSSNNVIGSIKNYAIIAIGTVFFIIVAIIVLIYLIHKENKKLNSKEDNNEYNVYDNDDNEFKKNGSPYKDAQIDKNIKEALQEINKEDKDDYDITGQNVEYEPNHKEQTDEQTKERKNKGKH